MSAWVLSKYKWYSFFFRGKKSMCHSYTLLTSPFPILSHLGFPEHMLPARYLKLRPGENFEGCNRTVEDLLWITWDDGEIVVGCEWLVYALHCNMAICGIAIHFKSCKCIQMLQMLEALKKGILTLLEHLQPARSGFGSQAGWGGAGLSLSLTMLVWTPLTAAHAACGDLNMFVSKY